MSRSGYTCVRYIFCYINVLIWLSGCGVLGVGVWLKTNHDGYTSLVPQYSWLGADIVFIVIGSVTVLVTFFACCGSWFQSRCMLITYFSLVIFMFTLEFAIATLAFVYRERINDMLKDELRDGIEHHYRNGTDNGLAMIWGHTQNQFQCCGIDSYEDWYDIDAWRGRKIVPPSCCLQKYKENSECWKEDNQSLWFSRGCSEQVLMWFVSQLHIIGIVGLIVSFIQLFGLISAMLLFFTVKNKRSNGHHYKAYPTS